ncbi:hypothetical protein ACN47E_003160 [Coniothyrium glycines]
MKTDDVIQAQLPLHEQHRTLTREQVSLRNQQNSPLLRLPAEIRHKIYAFALGGFEFRVSDNQKFGRKTRLVHKASRSRVWASGRVVLALTETSRQIYAETKELPFLLNVFAGTPITFKPFITGRAFAATNVELINYLKIHVTFLDMSSATYEAGQPVWKLGGHLRDLILVICGLPNLSSVEFHWSNTSGRCDAGGLGRVPGYYEARRTLFEEATILLRRHSKAANLVINLTTPRRLSVKC